MARHLYRSFPRVSLASSICLFFVINLLVTVCVIDGLFSRFWWRHRDTDGPGNNAATASGEAETPPSDAPADHARGRGLRRAFLTSSLSFFLLINVLGAVAIVDGLWSKTLLVSGTVTTGDVKAVWGDLSSNDEGTTGDPCTAGVNPDCPTTVTRPHVATCTIDDAGIGGHTANAVITDAYSSYECTVTGYIANVGSVPFNIIGAQLIFNNGNDAGLEQLGNCTVADDPQVDPDDYTVEPTSMKPVSCTVHVTSSAQPGWRYYFALEACVAQWNEDPVAGDSAPADLAACKNPVVGIHEGPDTPTLSTPHPVATPTPPP